MASGVQSMRLCLRAFRHGPVPRKAGTRAYISRRAFSSTTIQRRPEVKTGEDVDLGNAEAEDGGKEETYESGILDLAEPGNPRNLAPRDVTDRESVSRMLQSKSIMEADAILKNAARKPTASVMQRSLWLDEEEEEDMLVDEPEEDEFDEDDIISLAHGKLEEFREYREYARVAAWEMPLLSKLARPFEPPTAQEPLRFRYTSYMGEFHPAEHKVVVEFTPKDLPLNEAQQLKLKKLLGPRYNPETDIARMSCEQFEHQAQNKRYLGDLVETLVAQAKDPSDMFEDIPLDTRHHTFKIKPKFPKEWRMTEDRRKFLDDTRQKSLLTDKAKEETGALINGQEKIEQFFNPPPPQPRVPQFVRAQLNEPLSGGRPVPLPRRF
ncbi:37S ribosomal protein S24, mitochondrial [Parahypoxylon ruwenzoriense]